MRDELRNWGEKSYWCYGLNQQDFDYTVRLVADFVEQSTAKVQAETRRIEQEYSDPSISCEVISDIAHYAWVDQQYLWQFAIWRLQGILEGMIVYRFLGRESSNGLIGLKKKLEAMTECGFVIADSEEDELLEWAKIRNALSHAPPEQYRPGPLRREDIDEYCDFAKNICSKWAKQLEEMGRNA